MQAVKCRGAVKFGEIIVDIRAYDVDFIKQLYVDFRANDVDFIE